tara:strand:- start:14421 stop:16373 length:1953 start_codon:yes stop_codon:yes gene_type:complete
MSRLLRYFAFSSFVFVFIAAMLLAMFSQHVLNQTLLEQGQVQNQRFAAAVDLSVVEQAIAVKLAATPALKQTAEKRFGDSLGALMQGSSVVEVGLLDNDGRLLYQSKNTGIEASEIFVELSDAQLQALWVAGLQSQLVAATLSKGTFQEEAQEGAKADQSLQLVITWVPLRLGGPDNSNTILVLSADMTLLHARIKHNRYLLGAASALVMLLLYVTLYLLARYADARFKKYDAELQLVMAAQNSAKLELEQRVLERTQVLKNEIHERRQTEQELRDKEGYLQAVMENTFNGIICIDKHGQMRSFNPTAERMFGYSQQQVLGKNVSLLMPAEHAVKHDGYINNYLSTGKAAIIGSLRALKGLRQDGSEFPMELAITEAQVTGEPIFIGTIRDISDQELAEKALSEARQKYYHQEKMAAIGFLSAGLVHEIGNPIAAISGLLNGICDPGTEHLHCNAKANQQLRMVQEQVQRIINITRDVSEFATPQSQGPELQDLNNLIGRTCRLMRHDQRFTELDLRLELDNQLPAIYAVGDHLIQVLMNLLVNAVDAVAERSAVTDQRGQIFVSTGVEADRLWFEIYDNGCGMDAEVLSHAKEAFYTTKPVGQGTGLGLSLCQSLLSKQGGEMTIRSVSGEGTWIRVWLPTQPAAESSL